MKKFLLMMVVALGIGLVLTSCKSKEERFIADLQELTEKLEKADGVTDVLAITTKADREMKSKYGEHWDNMVPEGLNLTDEQKAQVLKLQERMSVAAAQKAASGFGDIMDAVGSAANTLGSAAEALDALTGSDDSKDTQEE